MKYRNITRAAFLRRPNRFLAEVDMDGRTETVHVKKYRQMQRTPDPGV